MANVKISNLPVETNLANMTGIAGYNAAGTCKISGADLINTLPTPPLGDVLTAGNDAIDQEILLKTTSDIRVLRLDKNGLAMNNFNTDLLITANSGGRLFLSSNINDVVVQSGGTGQVVFNTPEIALQSGDVLDSTSSAGSTGQVLSSLGAGNGTEWVAAGGPASGLGDVLTTDNESNDGQILAMIDGVERLEVSKDQIRHTGTSGDFDIVNANGTLRLSATGGLGLILNSSNTIKVLDDVEFDVNGIIDRLGNLGTGGQFLASTGSALEWTTPSSGGGGGYTTLTSAASTVWDGSNGLSASWQPTVTTPFNTLDMSSGFSAGDRGSLIIDVSTTTSFILPSNSKAADGDISVSGVNKTILDYVYDGTNFYWSNRKNMIDPIYLPLIATNDLVSFYVPSQYQGSPGNVPIGNAWANSYTSNNLVGDLSRVGTDLDDIQFVAKDDVNEIPAHFLCGSDGSTSSYWNVASALGGNVLGGSWTGALWFKTIPATSSSFHGMMDPDKDDDESIYVYLRRLYIEGPNLHTNFPSFEPAGTGGNDNTFSLEDEWIYVSVSFDHPNNTMSVILACQATLDNAGGTIIGYDGSNINISADGTYQETLSSTLTDNTWDDFAYGASVSTTGTAFAFEGGLGLAAVYGTNITDTLAISNWNSTKEYYYIS